MNSNVNGANTNRLVLSGVVKKVNTQPHHTAGMLNYFEIPLEIKRPDGKTDVVSLSVGENLLKQLGEKFQEGQRLQVFGEYRSYKSMGDKPWVFGQVNSIMVCEESENDTNRVEITGEICKVFEQKKTDKNDSTVLNFKIKVKGTGNKVYYIPCTLWNPMDELVRQLVLGKRVSIFGRAQSRTKDLGEGKTKEVNNQYLLVKTVVIL
jgi:hypothetical protein